MASRSVHLQTAIEDGPGIVDLKVEAPPALAYCPQFTEMLEAERGIM